MGMGKKKNNPSDRRQFIRHSALWSVSAFFGIPLLSGRSNFHFSPLRLPEKSEALIILNDRPINAETPVHLLDNPLTPNDLFFVRNNGIPPKTFDLKNWTLTIEGEAAKEKKVFSLESLKRDFKQYSYQLTLECGGNGRKEFNPPAKGNQWSLGAVGCATWTGVRLRDVLESAGIKPSAKYIGYYGKDSHLSGDPNKVPISRGVPMAKALADESLIAWSMNGKDIPVLNGFPLRLVFGGWPASCSGKWLERIVIRDKIHDGPKMGGQAYRVPCNPVAPGSKVQDEDMCIIEGMPVKSLITYPKTGAMIKINRILNIRGHAWAGDNAVEKMEYSIDFGRNWKNCKLTTPVNRHAWQHFSASIQFPKIGYYEVWARATDDQGNSQPMLLPGWNPKGYLNNACHRIAVKVID